MAVDLFSETTWPTHRTMHGQVVETIGREIVSGRIAAGDQLPPEPDLCAQLGVSRGALREAMKALAAKGLIEMRPRTGTRVTERTAWNLLDREVLSWLLTSDPEIALQHLTEVRKAIEPMAAMLAAERAKQIDLDELQSAYEDMRLAAEAASRARYIDADLRFHRTLMRASRNPLIAVIGKSFELLLSASFEVTSTVSGAVLRNVLSHGAVLDAVILGDGDAASAEMTRLIVSAEHDAAAARIRAGSKPASA